METAALMRRYAILFSIAIAFVFLAFAIDNYKKAYADGLFMENLPPASIGDRNASLFVRINPPILVTGSDKDAYAQFRLFDARNNETIKFTTFEITVTKGTEKGAQRLFEDKFTAPNGLLTLHITPINASAQVYGTYDDIYGYQADPGGNVKISGPLLLEGGLYHFHIEILGIDTAKSLFNGTQSPKFDSYLSVGDVVTKQVSTGASPLNATLISYYDRSNDFNLSGNKTFTWTMPFDWNASRVKAANSFLVHEEVRIPTNLAGVGDTNSFNASLNGNSNLGKIIVDPFTFKDAVVVHYFLGKNDVLNALGNDSKLASAKQMQFTLRPEHRLAENETNGEWTAERIPVLATWSPSQLAAGKNAQVELKFIDAQGTGMQVSGNVHYDLTVKNAAGDTVLSKNGLVANNGADTQTLNFPSNQTYRIEAKINYIDYPNLPSDIRPDYARGVVIVPEFPAGSVIAVGGIIAFAVILQRLSSRK